MSHADAIQRSLVAALRQVITQLLRALEEEDPTRVLAPTGSLAAALRSWRETVAEQTSGVDIARARELEEQALALRGKVATRDKEIADLKERNADLRAQIVALNKREQAYKQRVLDARFTGNAAVRDVKKLDLEVRELRRRIRELEGGPPLTPAEAVDIGLQVVRGLQAVFAAEGIDVRAHTLPESVAHENGEFICRLGGGEIRGDALPPSPPGFIRDFAPAQLDALDPADVGDDGDDVLVLAGYNAGEQAAERWRDRYREHERDEFIELISYRETRNYVKKVLRNLRNYRRLYGTRAVASTNGGEQSSR